MNVLEYDESVGDDEYLEKVGKYAAHHGVERGERDDDYAWCVRVRCHAAGIPLGGRDGHRYTCELVPSCGMGGVLEVVDTENECPVMRRVCTVRESTALMVLAALNMYDRAEKGHAS